MNAQSQNREPSQQDSIDAEAATPRGGYINRRRVMNMFATVAAAPVLIMARPAEAGASRFEWDRLFAAMEEADRAYQAQRAIYDAVEPSYHAGEPSVDMIDMKAGRFDFMDRRHVAFSFDLDAHSNRFLSREGKTWWAKDADAEKAKFQAALDGVREWRRLDNENRARHDWEGLNDRLDELAAAFSDAQDALVMLPAPDGAALAWKLECLFGEDARGISGSSPSYAAELIDAVLADSRRLLSNGRA